MTTCTPLKPFRCWQYRKDSIEPVPKWTIGLRRYVKDRWWLVQVFGRSTWYTPAKFAERFRVETTKDA